MKIFKSVIEEIKINQNIIIFIVKHGDENSKLLI